MIRHGDGAITAPPTACPNGSSRPRTARPFWAASKILNEKQGYELNPTAGVPGHAKGARMSIYQPVDLILGLLMIPLGMLCLVQDLRRILTRIFRNRYADWRSLTLGVWFVSSGPEHLSKAFNPRHHESDLTATLQTVALWFIAAILIANLVAWIMRRHRKPEQVRMRI